MHFLKFDLNSSHLIRMKLSCVQRSGFLEKRNKFRIFTCSYKFNNLKMPFKN